MEEQMVKTEALKQPQKDKSVDRKQLIVFRQGNEHYALLIDQIKEVVMTPHITRLPQTPSYIKGVANIRGNIITLFDLEEKFELNSREEVVSTSKTGSYTLVVENDQLKIGILVREVPDTLSVPVSALDDTLNIRQEEDEDNYIRGIVKLNDKLIILIDILKVFSEQDMKMASARI
jgi:purine-binding chemotaxis protein CheW